MDGDQCHSCSGTGYTRTLVAICVCGTPPLQNTPHRLSVEIGVPCVLRAVCHFKTVLVWSSLLCSGTGYTNSLESVLH